MHTKRTLAAAATAVALLGAAMAGAVAEPTPLPDTGTKRLSGANRYATAVDISKNSFTTPQDTVYIASGETFADALPAGPLAAALKAPILLVPKDYLPGVVSTELGRLQPKRIFVLGGDSVVSPATLDAIAGYAPIGGTERIAGTNRYATAEKLVEGFDPADVDVVYLASGEGFADALGGGAAAAHEGGALLLTANKSLPAETRRALQFLTPTEVVILGSDAVVTGAVADAVEAATGLTPHRHAGRDRYETAALVADDVWGVSGSRAVFLASGDSFPDALAATPSASINGAPIMLTRSTCTPLVTALAHDGLAPDLSVFLGSAAVTFDGEKIC